MRLKRGWLQQQLADACGLSARTIQRIELGHAARVESLKSIAAVFEVHFLTLTETAMKDELLRLSIGLFAVVIQVCELTK